jgi:hypothetical protein
MIGCEEAALSREKPGKDQIGYEALTQAALKGVMRAAMQKAAKGSALPGEHHFYVTFRTGARGVEMADHLKDRFPEEMTVVIQHQYWDFLVSDDGFEIVLKFSGAPQRLCVPFSAVTRFFDPSVNFGLQFDPGVSPEPGPPPGEGAQADADKSPPEGTVVSLDAFRRK